MPGRVCFIENFKTNIIVQNEVKDEHLTLSYHVTYLPHSGGTVDATHADIILKVVDQGRLRGRTTMYFEILLISCNHEKQVYWH